MLHSNLIHFDPWQRLNRLQRDLNTVFDRPTSDEQAATNEWRPAIDVKEEPDRFVILADIPGVDPKDIDVHMENSLLTIKGERTLENVEEQDNFKRVERTYGSFFRQFNLPDTANADKISANSKHGVLEVVIPKQDKLQPRKIAVKS